MELKAIKDSYIKEFDILEKLFIENNLNLQVIIAERKRLYSCSNIDQLQELKLDEVIPTLRAIVNRKGGGEIRL